jgi:hypothetical protein
MNENENISLPSSNEEQSSQSVNEGDSLRSIDNTNAPFSDTDANEGQNSKYKGELEEGFRNEFNEKIGRGRQKDNDPQEELKLGRVRLPTEKSSGNIKPQKEKKYIIKEHWDDDQKDFFNSLDPDTQSKVLSLFKDSQNKYEKITNRYKKDYTNMQSYLAPIIENVNSRMENPSERDIAEYANQLAQLHNTIEDDPALFISRLVDRFNITQDQIDKAYKRLDNEGEVDRYVEPMAKHLNSLQEKMSEYETNRYVDELSRLYDNMLGEKNQDGSLKYKYLDQIGIEDFALILQNMGIEDFDEGYETYIWASPKIRKNMLEYKNTQKNIERKSVKENNRYPTSIASTKEMPITSSQDKNSDKVSFEEMFYSNLRDKGF